jgi:hypothetical protein
MSMSREKSAPPIRNSKLETRNSKVGRVRGVYGADPHASEPRIQRIVDRFFLDEDGLVIGAIKGSSLRRYTRADMRGVPLEKTIGADLGAPHKYKLLVMNYEETGMAHGDYLMAMLEKYKATGDRAVRARARGAFRAIRQLADTVARTNPYGRGWWPKPYGGMRDLNEMFETSIDQVSKIVLGLAQYEREMATERERQWIRMQVRAMADWWIRHHFTTRYFGNCCWWDLHEMCHSASGLLYLVRQAMAWTPGRPPRHVAEAWQHLLGNRQRVLTNTRTHNVHNLTMECVRRLCDLDPAHRRLWRRSAMAMVERTIRDTDPVAGTNAMLPYGIYNTGPRAACTAATAYAWTGKRQYADFAWRLLGIYNREAKFYHHDPSHRPPRSIVSWWLDALSGHHYTAWLLAYWRLRNAGLPA